MSVYIALGMGEGKEGTEGSGREKPCSSFQRIQTWSTPRGSSELGTFRPQSAESFAILQQP